MIDNQALNHFYDEQTKTLRIQDDSISLTQVLAILPALETLECVEVFGSLIVKLDVDINLPGIDLVIIAPLWAIEKPITINLSGKNGVDGGSGQLDGLPGGVGQNGGNFYGRGSILIQKNKLIIKVNGGNGGKGGDGLNGKDGADGKNGDKSEVEKREDSALVKREKLKYSDGKVKFVVESLMTFNDRFESEYTSKGEPGQDGESAGKAGHGGLGGFPGKIGVVFPDETLLEVEKEEFEGTQGETGQPGLPGKGGKGGVSFTGIYLKSIACPSLRKGYGKKEKSKGQENKENKESEKSEESGERLESEEREKSEEKKNEEREKSEESGEREESEEREESGEREKSEESGEREGKDVKGKMTAPFVAAGVAATNYAAQKTAEQLVVEAGKEVTKEITKQMLKEGATALTKEAAQEIGKEITKQVTLKVGEETLKKAGGAVVKDSLTSAVTGTIGGSLQGAFSKEVVRQTARSAGSGLKTTASAAGKGALSWGSIGYSLGLSLLVQAGTSIMAEALIKGWTKEIETIYEKDGEDGKVADGVNQEGFDDPQENRRLDLDSITAKYLRFNPQSFF